MSQSGSGAAVGVPLLEGATGSGSSAAAPAKPTCSAALLLGFPSAADVTAPALKGVLLLAHALAEEQRKPLQEFAETVLSLVLPQAAVPPPPLDAPLDARPQPEAQPALSDWSGDSDSSAEDGSVWGDEPGNGVRGEAAGLGGGLAPAPLVSLRGFRSGVQEARFAAHHAAQMLRLDACAYLLAFACFCLQASCPGTPLRLWRRMGPRCLLGAAAQLPGLLLLSGGTRPWFRAHRDALLALTWLAVAAWQQSLGSHLHPLASAPFRDPLHSHSFSWLTVMGLAFQMRFRYQAPAAIAAYAANVALLPASRTARCCEPPGAGCGPGAALRAALHGLLLPLACCYVFEAHARRLFLRSEARRRV